MSVMVSTCPQCVPVCPASASLLFVFGVEALQQGPEHVARDLLVPVDERLHRLLHLVGGGAGDTASVKLGSLIPSSHSKHCRIQNKGFPFKGTLHPFALSFVLLETESYF